MKMRQQKQLDKRNLKHEPNRKLFVKSSSYNDKLWKKLK
jgi:hypothetical protein